MYDNFEFVICCAGESTRNFPHSKGLAHKSLLPFGDMRLIDYVLRDIIHMGGRHITLVCSNESVVKSFHRALENDEKTENKLRQKGKNEIADVLHNTFLPDDIDLKFVLQSEPLGTGHVLYSAADMIQDRHVVILFPDDIIISGNPNHPHIQKLVDAFLTNPKRALITGLWREDVSNNAIIVNGRMVEKPKNPTSHIAGMSPNVLPNAVIQYIKNQGQQYIDKTHATHKEWLYQDALNDFLDKGGEEEGYSVDMFLKSDEDLMLDTGTLPLYEQGQVYALLKLSSFAHQNQELAKKLIND